MLVGKSVWLSEFGKNKTRKLKEKTCDYLSTVFFWFGVIKMTDKLLNKLDLKKVTDSKFSQVFVLIMDQFQSQI